MSAALLALLALPPLGAGACLVPAAARLARWVSLVVCAATLALALAVAGGVLAHGESAALGGWLHADALAVVLALVVGAVGTAAAWYGLDHAPAPPPGRAPERAAARYHALFLVLHAALLGALFANNLGLMWIAVEASTLASALLIGFERRPIAIGAAWKFLILCSVGIVLALFATVLLYYSAVGTFGEGARGLEWSALRDAATQLEPRFVKLAFLFALVGYGTKAGVAPMHTWLPDAHAEAPTPVSAVLSGGVLTASLAALLRFHAIAVRGVGPGYSETLLTVFGLLSLAIAVPFVLVQDDYKRLLAYSSIENIGLTTFAIGLGAPLARFGGVLHLGVQAIAKTLAFLVGGVLVHARGTRRMDHWAGVMAGAPATGALFLVAGLGLAALPPAATFLSEWLALLGGLQGNRTLAVFAAVVLLALVFVGFAYHWTRVLLGRAHESATAAAPVPAPPAAWALAAVLLVLGAWIPEPLRRLVEQAAAVIRP